MCLPCEAPPGLKGNGILLKRLGDPHDLLKFAIQNLTSLRVEDMKLICQARGIVPEKNEDGKVNKHELWVALATSVLEGDELDAVVDFVKKKQSKVPRLGLYGPWSQRFAGNQD